MRTGRGASQSELDCHLEDSQEMKLSFITIATCTIVIIIIRGNHCMAGLSMSIPGVR